MRTPWTRDTRPRSTESSAHASRHRATRDEGRILTWPIGIFATVVGIFSAIFFSRVVTADDFSSLWIAGLLYRDGDKELLYDRSPNDFASIQDPVWWEHAINLDAADAHPYPHPFVHMPIMAELNSYLSNWMDYSTAVWILTAISGFSIVMIISAAWQLWFKETIGLIPLAVATLALWVSLPSQVSFMLGQTSPVITFGILAAIALARRKPLVAALFLGPVTVVKLTPVFVIFAMLLWTRTRKAGLYSLALTAGITAYSYVKDSASFEEWTEVLGDVSSVGLLHLFNLSPLSFLSRYEEVIPDYHHLATIPIVPELNPVYVWGVRAIVLILLGILALFAWKSQGRGFELFAIGGWAVTMLASNILWQHYLVFVPALILGIFWFMHFVSEKIRNSLLFVTVLGAATLYAPLSSQDLQDRLGIEWIMYYGFLALIVTFLVAAGVYVWEGMKHNQSQ